MLKSSAAAPLRVVTFNYNPWAFEHVRAWIVKHNHKHVLAVTTPGPKSRPTPSYTGIVEAAPRNLDVLVSTRMKTVITPTVRALRPDLILCFSFPYRLSAELCAIPKLGAVNLHPAPLPAYRGQNVLRIIYDGNPIGAALHWVAEEFDTGNLLRTNVYFRLAAVPTAILIALSQALLNCTRNGHDAIVIGSPVTLA